MGTRSKIVVSSKSANKTAVLYKHWDGYPSDNLNMFLEAFKNSNQFDQFVAGCGVYYGRPDMVELESEFAPNIIMRSDYPLQGDLEYFYMVDVDAKNIDVFGNGYGDEREHFKAGKIHPIREVSSYCPEYQLQYRTKLVELVTGLESLGVSINGSASKESTLEAQLDRLTKENNKLSGELNDLKREADDDARNLVDIKKEFFNKMTSNQLKDFLELSGLSVLKVTKCREPGAFNVYLDPAGKSFKSPGLRTACQQVNWVGAVLGLSLEVK